MVKVFNENIKYNALGKEYSGQDLNEFMTRIQNTDYKYNSEEERDLYDWCWRCLNGRY